MELEDVSEEVKREARRVAAAFGLTEWSPYPPVVTSNNLDFTGCNGPYMARWLIEQVFGCQGRYRRLSRDYEGNPRLSRATIQGANIHRWLRKLRPAPSTEPPFRY